jgi:hypothetical protein
MPKAILFFINRRRLFGNIALSHTAEFSYPSRIDLSQFAMGGHQPIPAKPSAALKISLGGFSEVFQPFEDGAQLTAVVNFVGSDNAGHYYAHRLHREASLPYARRWICVNDGRTSAVSLQDVMNMKSTVLLLHYEFPC